MMMAVHRIERKQNLILVLLGFIVYLLMRRESRPQTPSATKQAITERSLEELSPTYAEMVRDDKTIYDLAPEAAHAYIRAVTQEFFAQTLSPVERERVTEKVSSFFYYGRSYDEMREAVLAKQSQRWLDEIEEANQ
ncbi:MAG: hypothetical protein SF029_18090 [bacterium]|nr:hypothetical protein [bacterium]